MKRERSLLMLTSLAANALDEVYGMGKVQPFFVSNISISSCRVYYLLLYLYNTAEKRILPFAVCFVS